MFSWVLNAINRNQCINWKETIFWPASKQKHEAYEKLVEISRNYHYTTGNLLDYLYHQKYYQPIGTDLSTQTITSIPQQINFVEKLEEDDDAKMFFIAEKQQKTILNFYLD